MIESGKFKAAKTFVWLVSGFFPVALELSNGRKTVAARRADAFGSRGDIAMHRCLGGALQDVKVIRARISSLLEIGRVQSKVSALVFSIAAFAKCRSKPTGEWPFLLKTERTPHAQGEQVYCGMYQLKMRGFHLGEREIDSYCRRL